ncbi:MAG: preprotein translocase subunit SecG [Chitinophagaceae bacterium]
MTLLFIILIILASVILGFIVLVQNPKGGGLAGNVAGFSNQFMGVKQTTDVLEKGTWVFAAVVAALCMLSVFFIPKTVTSSGSDSDVQNATVPATNQTTPANTVPLGPAPAQPVPNR